MPPPPDTDALERRVKELEAEFRKFVHDVNNPLGVIRMAAFFLQSVPPDHEKRNEYFGLINENLDRVDRLVRDARKVYRAGTEEQPGPDPSA